MDTWLLHVSWCFEPSHPHTTYNSNTKKRHTQNVHRLLRLSFTLSTQILLTLFNMYTQLRVKKNKLYGKAARKRCVFSWDWKDDKEERRIYRRSEFQTSPNKWSLVLNGSRASTCQVDMWDCQKVAMPRLPLQGLGSSSAVLLSGQLQAFFTITACVRQKCLLALLREDQAGNTPWPPHIQLHWWQAHCNLVFADDTSLMGDNKGEPHGHTNKFVDRAREYKMDVSTEKSRIMTNTLVGALSPVIHRGLP